MTEQKIENGHFLNNQTIMYWLSLGIFFGASLFPQSRLWGVNAWAYFSIVTRLIVFLLLAAVPFVLYRLQFSTKDNNQQRQFIAFAVAVAFVLATLFFFLRAKIFFLGDGYQILAAMDAGSSFIKNTEYGEVVVHLWMRSILGSDALLSYQLLSIASGICGMAALIVFAARNLNGLFARLIFFIGSSAGGYMLLFFGYVENYSLFAFSVLLFILLGLEITTGRQKQWLIIVPLAMAIFFHLMGVTLIPAALYLLLSKTKVGGILSALDNSSKYLIGIIAAVLALAVFTYAFQTSLFFRFAFVPPIANRFTIEGYTLFSMSHLTDMFNLLFLLFPGVIVAATLFQKIKQSARFNKNAWTFITTLALSGFGAAFIFDPKLGMPRDWDLFAFAGMAIVTGSFYFLASLCERDSSIRHGLILVIILCLSILLPRAIVTATPKKGVASFLTYLELDKIKNRSGRHLLIKYLRQQGDSISANIAQQKWQNDFPEVQLALYGNNLSRDGKTEEAIEINRQAIAINPVYWVSYFNLGTYFNRLGNFDSAAVYLEITNGLNPNNTQVLNNLGYATMQLTRFDDAEESFLQCVELNKEAVEPILNLLQLYKSSGQTDKFNHYLFIAAAKDGAPPPVFKELGDYHLNRGAFDLAKAAYDTSLALGMDSAVILELRQNFPQLGE